MADYNDYADDYGDDGDSMISMDENVSDVSVDENVDVDVDVKIGGGNDQDEQEDEDDLTNETDDETNDDTDDEFDGEDPDAEPEPDQEVEQDADADAEDEIKTEADDKDDEADDEELGPELTAKENPVTIYQNINKIKETYYATKFEISEAIGIRATQIANGAPTALSENDLKNLTDTVSIAELELKYKKSPIIIRRKLPNSNNFIDIPISEMNIGLN